MQSMTFNVFCPVGGSVGEYPLFPCARGILSRPYIRYDDMCNPFTLAFDRVRFPPPPRGRCFVLPLCNSSTASFNSRKIRMKMMEKAGYAKRGESGAG